MQVCCVFSAFSATSCIFSAILTGVLRKRWCVYGQRTSVFAGNIRMSLWGSQGGGLRARQHGAVCNVAILEVGEWAKCEFCEFVNL